MAHTKQLLHHPHMFCMVPTTPRVQLSGADQGKREVRAQNRAPVPAIPQASAGIRQVARVYVSLPVQGILERFSLSHLTAKKYPSVRTGNRPADRITCLE